MCVCVCVCVCVCECVCECVCVCVCVCVSRGGMLEYNEGYITGMGYLSMVNTEVNYLLMAFALSRSFVIGLSFTLRVGMPMFSRLFALFVL